MSALPIIPPKPMLTGDPETRESYAYSILFEAYSRARQTPEDFIPVEDVRMTRGETRWISQPYIRSGIAASQRDPVHYGKLLNHVIYYFQVAYDSAPAGSDVRTEAWRALYWKQEEQRHYNMSPRDQALAALYEASNGTEPETYLQLYKAAMLKAAAIDPVETANEAFRVFVTNRLGWKDGKKEQESDKPIRAVALDIIRSAGHTLALNPEMGGPEAALALSNEFLATRFDFHGWAYSNDPADPLVAVARAISKNAAEQAQVNAAAELAAGAKMAEQVVEPTVATEYDPALAQQGLALVRTQNAMPLFDNSLPFAAD